MLQSGCEEPELEHDAVPEGSSKLGTIERVRDRTSKLVNRGADGTDHDLDSEPNSAA